LRGRDERGRRTCRHPRRDPRSSDAGGGDPERRREARVSTVRPDLLDLQRHTFGYFVHEANPANGLVRDNTRYGSPSSIAAVGLSLACWPIPVEGEGANRGGGGQRGLGR